MRSVYIFGFCLGRGGAEIYPQKNLPLKGGFFTSDTNMVIETGQDMMVTGLWKKLISHNYS